MRVTAAVVKEESQPFEIEELELEEINQAAKDAEEGNALKPVLRMEQPGSDAV